VINTIYAVDFDGTLCERAYPKIGEPIQAVIDYAKQLSIDGHQLILWTCRTDDKLQEAIDWCDSQSLKFDAVNENLQSEIDAWGTDPRKIAADFYIDDKAVTVDSIITEKEVKQLIETKPKQMWDLKQAVQLDALDLHIYGYIEEMTYDYATGNVAVSENSAKHFREALEAFPDVKQINVFVNSLGGYVIEAMAIRNQLKRHPAHVTGYVDGLAASAATFILTACDTVKMYSNTEQLLHNAESLSAGNANDHRKNAEVLDALMVGNRKAYLEKSNGKITEEKLIEILEAAAWLSAEQCLEYGFCDEIITEKADMTAAKQMLQQMNHSLEQHISYNQSLTVLLRESLELFDTPKQVEPAIIVDPIITEPETPKQEETKIPKFLSALMR